MACKEVKAKFKKKLTELELTRPTSSMTADQKMVARLGVNMVENCFTYSPATLH